jgi:hypothetical protein
MANGNDIQCVICRRNLLTGEQAVTYTEPRSSSTVQVCSLCLERAEKNGLQRHDEPISLVIPVESPDRTVRTLKAQVNTLQTQLETTAERLEDTRGNSSDRETEIETLAARLADAEAEGAVVRAALAESERRLEQLQHDVEESQTAQATILRARRRESDEVYLAGIAAEVFNRSPQAATIGLLVGLHGTPTVRIDVIGAALPRPVLIAFAWGEGGRDYRVDIDLVARRFDLVDLVPGGDGRMVARLEPLYGNAEWLDGRIVTAPAEPTML